MVPYKSYNFFLWSYHDQCGIKNDSEHGQPGLFMGQSELINCPSGVISGSDYDRTEIKKILVSKWVAETCNLEKKFELLRTASFID